MQLKFRHIEHLVIFFFLLFPLIGKLKKVSLKRMDDGKIGLRVDNGSSRKRENGEKRKG